MSIIILYIYKEIRGNLVFFCEKIVFGACNCSNLVDLCWGCFSRYLNIKVVTPHKLHCGFFN